MASVLDQVAALRTMRYGDQSAAVSQIQSARQALRILDAEITRTEMRLRTLPGQVALAGAGGGGARSTAGQRMAARRARTGPKLFMASDAGARMGVFRVGGNGMMLSPHALKQLYGAGYAAAAMHVVAGIGSQVMNVQDKQAEMERQGISARARRAQLGLDVIGGTAKSAADIFGVNSLARMLLRPAFGEEESGRRVENAWRDIFENREVKEARLRRRDAAVKMALKDVDRQFRDDIEFLDAWTPDDFDVADDFGRAALKAEIWERNRMYVTAVNELRANQAADSVLNSGVD